MELVGGQAVIEGVMMRRKDEVATSVRLPDGSIITKRDTVRKLPKIFGLPFLRGVANMLDLMVLGMKSLTWSANQSVDDEDEKLSTFSIVMTVGFSLLLSVGIFVGIPFFLTLLTDTKGITFNIIDGIFRLLMFVGYLGIISFLPDIKRVFQYHGAEHKTINCYEAGNEMTVDNIQLQTTFHPRCGTTFLVFVMFVSIVLFTFIYTDVWYYKFIGRLLFVPIVAAVSYELLKVAWKYKEKGFFKVLVKPGMWTQRITTKNPDDQQVEVALTAFNAVNPSQS